jgi:uncharacterized membrane protein YbhN (UPF0104 family)
VDFREVWQQVRACDKGLVLLGAGCHYATYWFRGARWRRSLRHMQGAHGYGRFALIVFFYNFVDNVVPAKLGDVYGAHLAQINLGVPRPAALGSIVLQRVIDAWVVLLLAGISSSLVFADRLPDAVVWSLVGGGIIAGGASLVLVTFAVAHKLPDRWLPQAVRTRVASFHTGMLPRPREFLTIVLLTAIIWTLETLWMLLLALAFGIQLGAWQVVFLTMIPLLASTFPLTPSGVGVVELSLVGCLRALGAPGALATSITVLNRLLDFWLHIALGLFTWAIRGRLGLRTWREVPLGSPRDHAVAGSS